jgi:hypothetical protein
MLRKLLIGIVLCALAACMPAPPAPPAPRTAMSVNASFGKTWDSVIELFATRNIGIKTVDRSSGLIVAEVQRVVSQDASLADCGQNLYHQSFSPDLAYWNVLVRGDSTSSTVRANVRFTSSSSIAKECSSKGAWEFDLEQAVKAAAEAKR